MSKKSAALIILDGFALRDEDKGNAVTHAKTKLRPFLERVSSCYTSGVWRSLHEAYQKAKWVTLK